MRWVRTVTKAGQNTTTHLNTKYGVHFQHKKRMHNDES